METLPARAVARLLFKGGSLATAGMECSRQRTDTVTVSRGRSPQGIPERDTERKGDI